MGNKRNRPQIPYNGIKRPYYSRYEDLADNKQNLTGQQLDGDFDYLIDVVNDIDDSLAGIVAGAIPGSTLPENQYKFVTTNGQDPATIFYSKVTGNYLSELSVGEAALQNGAVTSSKISDGAILEAKYGPESIPASAYQNDTIPSNAIPNNTIPFDKIQNAQNNHFVDFVGSQIDGFLNGSKIQNGSIQGSAISESTITETKYATGSVSRRALATVLALEPGMIMHWTTQNAPTGWLFCNGQAVSRVTYAALFNNIGVSFGPGDGNTTFNLPDGRGLSFVSCDPSQAGNPGFTGNRVTNGVTYEIGYKFGSETVTLTGQHIPAHTHTVPRGQARQMRPVAPYTELLESASIRSESDVSSSYGGGQPHNNMQPSIFIPAIIYTGVA